MKGHDPIVVLRQMLAHSREALSLTEGHTRVDLDDDRVLSLALIRLLEIIGEAATRLSDDVRRRHPAVPWSQLVGLRNRLIHGYDAVDLDILWQILSSDLPALADTLDRVIDQEERAP